MKNLIYTAVAVIFLGQVAIAQPVSDRGIVPVAVTLNQILRLAITDGGNIEFVFNTIVDYTGGKANTALYDTQFTVASSTQWSVAMTADDATFIGTDNSANTMALANVGYIITENGVHNIATELIDVGSSTTTTLALAAGPITFLTSGAGAATNAGSVLDNVIIINWECGTANGSLSTNTNMLEQNLAADRYVTSVMIDLTAI